MKASQIKEQCADDRGLEAFKASPRAVEASTLKTGAPSVPEA
jgi:hypothetical protein